MIGKNSSDEKVLTELGNDVGALMAALVRKYRHHPNLMALALTRSLGNFIAICSSKPQEVLDATAVMLKEWDVAQSRSDYFGWQVVEGGKSAPDGPKIIAP